MVRVAAPRSRAKITPVAIHQNSTTTKTDRMNTRAVVSRVAMSIPPMDSARRARSSAIVARLT
jgi:hypothetical protein